MKHRQGVVRVPVIIQMEAQECGAASLTMVLAHYGKHIPLARIREECGVTRDGSNLKNIYQVAKSYDLETKVYRYSLDSLRTKVHYPCILHWEFNHFVVLDGFRRGKAVLNDPARGRVEVSMEELDRSYTGICMTLTPTEAFRPEGQPESIVQFVVKRLRGSGSMVAMVLLTSLLVTVASIFSPAMNRFFTDVLMPRKETSWPGGFFVIFLALAMLQLAALAIKTSFMWKLQGKMGVVATSGFLWKLLRLPIRFFEQRMDADLMERYASNEKMATGLLQTIVPLLLDLVSVLFYLVAMMTLNPVLATVGALSIVGSILVSLELSRRRNDLTRSLSRYNAQLNSVSLAGIHLIETVKATGAEDALFERWSEKYAAYSEQNIRLNRLDWRLGRIPSFLSMISSAIVLCAGALLVLRGRWTLGILVAFNGYLTAFSTPAASLLTGIQTFQETRTDMERIQDVMQNPDDPIFDAPRLREEEPEKLKGRLELRDISFGYNRLAPPLIEHFSMTLEEGKSTAIVGGSGSGKSTLAKLITRMYAPWSGEVLLDGRDIQQIPKETLNASVGFVTQDTVFFETNIRENISMMDETMPGQVVLQAALDAHIHQKIMERSEGYDSYLSQSGGGFSGGEKQRIGIARILAGLPGLLILDEATSALDSESEYNVIRAIRARNVSTLIISHRLSIIRDCDEIIVLHDGKVEDRGTHRELMERCPYYAALVTNE